MTDLAEREAFPLTVVHEVYARHAVREDVDDPDCDELPV